MGIFMYDLNEATYLVETYLDKKADNPQVLILY